MVTHEQSVADPANAPVDIYELKLVNNGTTAKAAAQLDNYVNGRVTPYGTSTGAYSLRIFTPPPAQAFTLTDIGHEATVGTRVATNSPAAGARHLETHLSKDTYTFTPTRTAEVLLDTTGHSALQWQLFDHDDNPLTDLAPFTKGNTFNVEADTTYRIDITFDPAKTHLTSASYAFTLREQPD